MYVNVCICVEIKGQLLGVGSSTTLVLGIEFRLSDMHTHIPRLFFMFFGPKITQEEQSWNPGSKVLC